MLTIHMHILGDIPHITLLTTYIHLPPSSPLLFVLIYYDLKEKEKRTKSTTLPIIFLFLFFFFSFLNLHAPIERRFDLVVSLYNGSWTDYIVFSMFSFYAACFMIYVFSLGFTWIYLDWVCTLHTQLLVYCGWWFGYLY